MRTAILATGLAGTIAIVAGLDWGIELLWQLEWARTWPYGLMIDPPPPPPYSGLLQISSAAVTVLFYLGLHVWFVRAEDAYVQRADTASPVELQG